MLDREIPLKWALPLIVVGAAILVFGIWTTFLADVAIESHETESRDADFFVQTSHEAPKVCQLHFTLLYRDHSYKRDAPAGVTGSLSWNEEKGIIGLYLKIIGGDFSNGYSGVQVPFKVFDGLVLVDGKPLFPQKTFPCEDQPTGYCGGYILQKSVDIYRAWRRRDPWLLLSGESQLDQISPLTYRSKLWIQVNSSTSINVWAF